MAPGGFCQDCFKGTLRGDAKPAGTVETIHGLPTYVARPDTQKKPLGVVVIVPDAFGWELLNTRALADSYARRGPFLVYLPDFMNGAALSASDLSIFDRVEAPSRDWWTRLVLKPWWVLTMVAHIVPFLFNVRAGVARPRIREFITSLRRDLESSQAAASSSSSSDPATSTTTTTPNRIGIVGFCWGGKYCIELCGSDSPADKPIVDCGFTAHPSMVSVPRDLERVRVPLSVANGDNDAFMGRRGMETLKRVLEEAKGESGRDGEEGPAKHEVAVYPGAVHGFAVRGDPKDPRQAELGMRAEDQAVAWFRRQFASLAPPADPSSGQSLGTAA